MSNAANNNSTNIGGVGNPALLVDLNVYNEILSHMRDTVDSLVFDSSPLDSVDEVNGTETTNILFDNWNLLVGAGGTTDQYRNFYLNIVDKYLTETGTSLEELDENAAGTLDTKMGPQVAGTSLAAASMSGSIPKAKTFASDKEAAEYLDQQFELLCDDDDTNDEEAIANINACLMGYLCIVQDGEDRYVAYDREKIEKVIPYLKKDGLAQQLFKSIDDNISDCKDNGSPVPEAIIKMKFGGKLENTLLQVRKDGAGVRLEITCNNDLLPGKEIKKQPVAYACTEESAENYFMTNGEYDWNAITKWLSLNDDFHDDYHKDSIEYSVLSWQMVLMNDSEINELLDCVEHKQDIDTVTRFQYLAGLHVEDVRGIKDSNTNYDNNKLENAYTRAVLIDTMAGELVEDKCENQSYILHIDSCKYDKSGKNEPGDLEYTGTITYCYEGVINPFVYTYTVEPYRECDSIRTNLDNTVITIADEGKITSKDVVKEIGDYAVEQAVSYALEKICGPVASVPYSVAKATYDFSKQAHEAKIRADGIRGAIVLGENAQCMMLKGTTVCTTDADGEKHFTVYSPEYDDKKLVYSVEAFNREHGTDYTIDDMKEEFNKKCSDKEYSGPFDQYSYWYANEKGRDAANEVENSVYTDLARKGYSDEQINALGVEDIQKILAEG